MADSKPYGDVAYADPGLQKDKKARYPIDTEAHAKAAWSYVNQGDNAAQYTAEQLASVKSRIKAALKKFGVDVSADSGSRTEELLPVRSCDRAYALDDLHIRADGDGRVVEAYAAVFNSPTEIMDQDGHYNETLSPTSFAKTISDKGLRFGVLFNHARTVDGQPNPLATLPVGVPLEVKPDARGVYTATRYLDNPLADHVLDAIKNGAITAQSFSGRFVKSTRSFPNGRSRGALPLISRHEVDMREYGPAVFAAYKDASILGTRAELFIRTLLETPSDRRLAFLEQFEGLTAPLLEPEALTLGTPAPAGAAGLTDEPRQHSARSIPLGTRIRAARIARHME